MTKTAAATRDLLFEIGCEELPATMLADLYENPVAAPDGSRRNALELKLRAALEAKRLAFADCRVLATPRRLAFHVTGLAARQSPKDDFTKVLAKAEAYDEAGRPTEKFLTILKHRKASLNETVVQPLQGREYVYIRRAEPALAAEKVLPELFADLVRTIGFAKNMRWDGSGLVFPRPIRSLLCLLGPMPVRFTVGRLTTGARTVVFRGGRRTTLSVRNVADYFALLKRHRVLLDPAERKREISRQLGALASKLGGRLYEDDFLLNEVNFLVESPHAIEAPFGSQFLGLPLEVLAVSMARKQRIFGMLDKKGQVMPRFLAVLDGAVDASGRALISRNIENILQAKLQDSLFFYQEDRKAPLEKKRAELRDLVFLKGAGSMLDKSERLVRLAGWAAPAAGLSAEDASRLERAAFLAKTDLLSHMVGEFPELQGVMGKYYALAAGEDETTARAVGEQYLPRTAGDRLPETTAGSLLSVLDKCDLIAACLAVGLEPTSSLDPYGLRRSATAILKIVIDRRLRLPVRSLAEEAVRALGPIAPEDKRADLRRKLHAFFRDRFEALLADRGYPADLVRSVLASGFDDPREAHERLEALAALLDTDAFARTCKVVERTSNILRGSKEKEFAEVDPALLAEELERGVHERYREYAGRIAEAGRARDFALATRLYAEAFFDILGKFFEQVFVNAPDPAVRRNRLGLLAAVNRVYTQDIADLSRMDPSRMASQTLPPGQAAKPHPSSGA